MKSTTSPSQHALIIGSGVGGLASACLLAKKGWRTTVVEKNNQPGGRVGIFKANGFTFDTGPSWYLMPDVFQRFFALLEEDADSHLMLTRLDPAFRIHYSGSKSLDISSDLKQNMTTFERIEKGSGLSLQRYLADMSYAYNVATEKFMYKNYDRLRDFFTFKMLHEGNKLNVLSSLHNVVGKRFNNSQQQQILEFSALFLGSKPTEIPALYGILNHALFTQGVFYPKHGMYTLIKALLKVGEKHGVEVLLSTGVQKILVKDGEARGVLTESGKQINADIVISNADLHHTEQQLLEPGQRAYSTQYWQTRTFAPSALLMYLGIKGHLPTLSHHNLVFGNDWQDNFTDLFDQTTWPSDPSMYLCNPSKTDPSTAPKGHENLLVLVPVAANLTYSNEEIQTYSDFVLKIIEKRLNIPGFGQKIIYKKLFCVKDFAEQFNSYRGSALGLAHTLPQSAVFRPNNINPKVKNLYYVGAGTNPGIGLPPALISAELMISRLKQK